MRDIRAEVLEIFAELSAPADAIFQASFDRQERRALYAKQYDAERAKVIRCDPRLRAKRIEQQSRYERKRWQRIKADEKLRAAHNAKRRAAHARLKADPGRLDRSRQKQQVYSSRHAAKRRRKP